MSPTHDANAADATAAAAWATPPAAAKLVFLPGLANDAEVWADVRVALQRVAPPALQPLLAAAQVGDLHTRHATLPQMAQALLEEHPGPLVLVGHSMGGMLALHAVRLAPARVVGLALLGTTARPDTPELLQLRRDACVQFAAGRLDEVLRANVAFAFHPEHAADAAMVARYFAIVRRAGAEQLIAQNQAVMARDDSRPHLAAIDTRACPTLVLCGEADGLTPPGVSREIADSVPGARFEVLPRCGHMLTLEQPAAVAERLADWLMQAVLRSGR
ncbi:MAG: alpha/beta fold hydrolase [Rubrivivax sp.]|nr:alpha/beta fold hydrolase [Rubrivivax sp.]